MRSDNFGPVPVSQLKHQVGPIFDALDSGKRVLVSRHGEIVAAIDPAPRVRLEMFQFEAAPNRYMKLTSTQINRGSPSKAIDAAIEGKRVYVTRNRRPVGLLRRSTDADVSAYLLTPEQVAELSERTEKYLLENSEADVDDVRRFQVGLEERWEGKSSGQREFVETLESQRRVVVRYLASETLSALNRIPSPAEIHDLAPMERHRVLRGLELVKEVFRVLDMDVEATDDDVSVDLDIDVGGIRERVELTRSLVERHHED